MKRRLDTTHNDETYLKLKNELNDKNAIIRKMEEEIASILKVRKGQEKALKQFNREDMSDDYVEKVKQNLVNRKAEWKRLIEECKIEDKQLKEEHKDKIELEERCRRFEKYIREAKLSKRSTKEPKSESKSELEYWRKKNEATETRQVEDYDNKIKIYKALKLRDSELQHELKLVKMKMKEREQEKKLKELKSREVNKKQKPHGKLKPINGARYFNKLIISIGTIRLVIGNV